MPTIEMECIRCGDRRRAAIPDDPGHEIPCRHRACVGRMTAALPREES